MLASVYAVLRGGHRFSQRRLAARPPVGLVPARALAAAAGNTSSFSRRRRQWQSHLSWSWSLEESGVCARGREVNLHRVSLPRLPACPPGRTACFALARLVYCSLVFTSYRVYIPGEDIGPTPKRTPSAADEIRAA